MVIFLYLKTIGRPGFEATKRVDPYLTPAASFLQMQPRPRRFACTECVGGAAICMQHHVQYCRINAWQLQNKTKIA